MIRKSMSLLLICLLLLTGCENPDVYGSLPDEPIVFENEPFVNPDNAEDTYACITYQGRRYLPYGTLGGMLTKKDIKACIGYVASEDYPDDTNTRIYTLQADEQLHYLMEYYTVGEMEQPFFWRAMDTKGREIDTPSFIDSLEYEYWA